MKLSHKHYLPNRVGSLRDKNPAGQGRDLSESRVNLLYTDQFNLENQHGVGRDDAACAALASSAFIRFPLFGILAQIF
jgi:hypothetical protein